MSHGFLAAQKWNSAKAKANFPALFLKRQRQNSLIQHLIRQGSHKANRFNRTEKQYDPWNWKACWQGRNNITGISSSWFYSQLTGLWSCTGPPGKTQAFQSENPRFIICIIWSRWPSGLVELQITEWREPGWGGVVTIWRFQDKQGRNDAADLFMRFHSFSHKKCVIKYGTTMDLLVLLFMFINTNFCLNLNICCIINSSWLMQYMRSKWAILLWENHFKSSRLFQEGHRCSHKGTWDRISQLYQSWYSYHITLCDN